MMPSAVFLCVMALAAMLNCVTSQGPSPNATFTHLVDTSFEYFKTALEQRKNQIVTVGEQAMINQHLQQQRVRAEVNSGLVSVRTYYNGFYNFNSNKHSMLGTYGSFHDHNTYKSIVGVGEMTLSLNGIQFTTKHHDYSLVKAHSTNTEWRAVEEIEAPPVPPSLNGMTIEQQTAEMIEYFRAWQLQDTEIRDYRPYFKPILCYLEGYWLANTTVPEEQQHNKLYNTRTKTHEDLFHKERLAAALGVPYETAHRITNLPKQIIDFDEFGNPIPAQWNYRILCHEFEESKVNKSYLRPVEDLVHRVNNYDDYKPEDIMFYRSTRFVYDEHDKPTIYKKTSALDKLVAEIPGLEHKSAVINSSSYIHRDFREARSSDIFNAIFYNHRYYDWYRDPNRMHEQLRGFADDNLYVALNERPEVAGMHVFTSWGNRLTDKNVRFSYMIPLEIIYMTPLQNWNPHNVQYYTDQDVRKGKTGKKNSPYIGSMDTLFIQTPVAFYNTSHPRGKLSNSIADSVAGFYYVKDGQGAAQQVAPAGLRTLTPPINGGVGSVRLRYPILPLSSEGHETYKDLNAFKVYVTKKLDELTKALTG